MKSKFVFLQELRGYYLVYLTKQYAKEHLKNGYIMAWEIEEGNYGILNLKKLEGGE